VSRPQFAEPGIAGDHRLAFESVRQTPGEDEAVGGEQELGDPMRGCRHLRDMSRRLVENLALPQLPALQRGLQIAGGIGLQAADDAGPPAGQQLEPGLGDLQVIVAII